MRTVFDRITITVTALMVSLLLVTHPCDARQAISDPDRAFEEARELAFGGHYDQARALARAVLEQEPDYHDVRILIARTYAWQQQYGRARQELAPVREAAPQYREGILAAIDLEYWDGNIREALGIARQASQDDPRDAELIVRQAHLMIELGDYGAAADQLNRLEGLGTHRDRVRELRERLAGRQVNNALQLYYTYDHYSERFDPWHLASLRYQRMTGNGPVLAHLNLARRFGESAWQGVLEGYPRLGERWYAHLNLAWSPDSIFPDWRAGGELYHAPGGGWEVSLGGRYLHFEAGEVVILTGSLTRYAGNWMFSARPYLGRLNEGYSRSGTLLARRYFGSMDDHLGLRAGFGFTPEERQLLGSPSGEVDLMQSRFAGLELHKMVARTVQWIAEVRLSSQEMQSAGDDVRIVTLTTGLSWRF